MEKDLQKKCINYARNKGLMIYSINPPNFKRTTYGTLYNLPDLHVVDYNAFFELKDIKYHKAHKERQEKQARRRRELFKHNASAYKITRLEDFIKILDFLNDKKESTSK